MLVATARINGARFTDQHRLHEMVSCAMEESWKVVSSHVDRYHAIMLSVVEEGVARGEFVVADPVSATHCVRTAMVRFFHPLLIGPCAALPGPSMDEMIDFVLVALGHRRPAI